MSDNESNTIDQDDREDRREDEDKDDNSDLEDSPEEKVEIVNVAGLPPDNFCPSISELENICLPNLKTDMAGSDYIEAEGIKIYTGTTPYLRNLYARNIEFLQKKNREIMQSALAGSPTVSKLLAKYLPSNQGELLTYFTPSTFTVTGALSNISFNEKNLMTQLPIPTGYIQRIDCNFGSKINPIFHEPPPQAKSNRGRKPKNKTQSNRKTQGSGKCMNSQITFSIVHPETKSKYKIKVSRNGSIHIPGALHRHLLDLIKPIKILCQYLNENYDKFKSSSAESNQPNNGIHALHLMTVMRDYKCSLVNKRLNVNISLFNRLIEQEKNSLYFKYYLKSIINDKTTVEPIEALLDKTNDINLAERSYNPDKAPPFSIKLQRPGIKKLDKKTTVKLLKSGKLNFDGANSDLEVCEIYQWTYYMYLKYFDQIIVDRDSIKNEFIPQDMENIKLEKLIFD